MHFAFPAYIYVWLLALLVLAVAFLLHRRSEALMQAWFNKEDYKRNYSLAKNIFRVVALLLMLFALAGPYWDSENESVNVLGREVYILLDVSSSMNTDDVKPSRLEKAKKELQKVIEELRGDRFGLIIFASQGYVQCPVTRDYKAAELYLDLIETSQMAQGGTDLRGGLQLALERFQIAEKRGERVSRAVVVVSDGEDFGDSYGSVIERLRSLGIKLFTVGVGTLEGGAVPDIVNGKIRGHKRQEDGMAAVSRLHEEPLQKLAEDFQTEYIPLNSPKSNLNELITQIRQLRSSPLEVRMEKINQDRYYTFLALGLFCWIISLFLMPIRVK